MTESTETTQTDENVTTTTDSSETTETAKTEETKNSLVSSAESEKDGEGKTEEEGKKTEEAKKEGEDFTDNTSESFELPEGFELAEERMTSVVEFTNKHQLSPEMVNEFMQLQAAWTAEDAKAASDAQHDAWSETQDKWVAEVKADEIVGGENLEGNLSKISDLIETFTANKEGEPDKAASDALRDAFNLTGAGNHPAMVRFLTAIANATLVKEGEPHPGGDTPAGKAEHGLYPNLD